MTTTSKMTKLALITILKSVADDMDATPRIDAGVRAPAGGAVAIGDQAYTDLAQHIRKLADTIKEV